MIMIWLKLYSMLNWLKNISVNLYGWFAGLSWQSRLFIFIAILYAISALYFINKIKSENRKYQDLYNKLITQSEMVKIKDGLYAAKVIELSDINEEFLLKDSAMKEIIDDAEEQIKYYTALSLQLESKIATIKSKEKIIYRDRDVEIILTKECADELKDKRFKVEFEYYEKPVKVTGHTLTNPAETDLKIDFDAINLKLVVTETVDGDEHYYVETDKDIKLSINNLKILKEKKADLRWYQKFMVGGGAMVGDDFNLRNSLFILSLNYKFFDNVFVGLSGGRLLDRDLNFYGLNIFWWIK